ncbi:MAG: ABC transporter ATP-binding protein [Bacteroidetes bacterium]|nr:ABC transporter ATP-binding protein [Bacteroidota bacterium]
MGIFGPNGCGKSTLLKLLSGVLNPKSGQVLLHNKNMRAINRKEIAKKIAFVPQSAPSIFSYTIYEIVAMGRTPYFGVFGFESEEDRTIINESLEILELDLMSDKCINEVSGGEAQRAYIARALAQKPEILLLDEPNSHLDLKHQVLIYDLLQKLNVEQRISIVTVSHDLNLSANYCKRAVLMNEGLVYCYGSISDVLTEEHIKNIFDLDSRVNFNYSEDDISIVIKPKKQTN